MSLADDWGSWASECERQRRTGEPEQPQRELPDAVTIARGLVVTTVAHGRVLRTTRSQLADVVPLRRCG